MAARFCTVIRLITVTACATALSACLGGGGGSSSATPAANNVVDTNLAKPRTPNGKRSQATNSVPTISGSPAREGTVAQAYGFTPSASDADGDTLTFLIQNKPDWATFDPATGRLSGTPTEGDVGSYTNITISVTDGVSSAALSPFTLSVVALADGKVTLSWTPPTSNVDGTTLTNLAGYKIYYGQNSASLTTVVQVGVEITSAVIENLSTGTWYFAMSSYNSSGVESEKTPAISKVI